MSVKMTFISSFINSGSQLAELDPDEKNCTFIVWLKIDCDFFVGRVGNETAKSCLQVTQTSK